MSVSSYEKDGKTLWKIYINIRDKENSSIREQKLVLGFESEKIALAEEKKLTREITEKLFKRASQGHAWEAIINMWEKAVTTDKTMYSYQPHTVVDRVKALLKWTESWLNRPASLLTKGDARDVFKLMEADGKSLGHRKHVKVMINVIFMWGIENKLIPNVHESPVKGMTLQGHKVEAAPDILTLEEIRKLLTDAKKLNHDWYPIWVTALLTGLRNGELHALEWKDVDFENRKMTISKSYNPRMRAVKCTKSGAWRTVPLSNELFDFLTELKKKTGHQKNVLPRFCEWDRGGQAKTLRIFCKGIGIRPIRFHALRACFATQLLAHDIAPARVMKICGWKDLKTMQHYVRLAGVDEKDATQVLRVLPNDEAAMKEIADLVDLKTVI
jgi:integrase